MRRGTRVIVGVGGGIAAVRALDVARLFMERGADVRAVMSRNAGKFITALSLEALTGAPVYKDLWNSSDLLYGGEPHVHLAAWAEALVVAPATMEGVAKLALGIPDDPLLLTALACSAPLVLAPAMHPIMFGQDATRRHLETLTARGATVVGPVHGRLAGGEEGLGRMASPAAIADAAAAAVGRHGDMAGVRLLLSAGPTCEPIDPVRVLSNRSSGKMGYALAAAARDRGARVTLISGPVTLAQPYGVQVIRVGTAQEMHDAVIQEADEVEVIVMAAAVADYRPTTSQAHKIKKSAESLILPLERTTDILGALASHAFRQRPLIVGFAAETENVEMEAERKLRSKGLDLIAANLVADGAVFGADTNTVTIIARDGRRTTVGPAAKVDVADALLDAIVALLPQLPPG